jgi:hypothetical protein
LKGTPGHGFGVSRRQTARTFYARHGFWGSPSSVEGTPDTGLGAAYPQPCPQIIVSLRYAQLLPVVLLVLLLLVTMTMPMMAMVAGGAR